MKKLLIDLGLILVGFLLILGFTSFDLAHEPVMKIVDILLLPMVVGVLFFMFYKSHHKMCWALVLLCGLSWQTPTYASEIICTELARYKAVVTEAEKNHWKGDEACNADYWDLAREETLAQKDNTDCAKELMSLCSEYYRRHPNEKQPDKVNADSDARTVAMILAEPIGRTKSGATPSSCWPCDMAYVVFTVIQNLSANLSDTMAEVGKLLLWAGLMIWVLYKGACMVVLPSKGTTFLGQIVYTFLGTLVAASILANAEGLSTLYSKVLSPIFQVGLGISEKVLDSVGPSSTLASTLETNITLPVSMDYCEASSGGGGSSGTSGTSGSSGSLAGFFNSIAGQVFPDMGDHFQLGSVDSDKTLLNDDLKASMLCLTQKFYYQSRPFIATGQSLISFAVHKGWNRFGLKIPDLKMWLFGALFVCLFAYFSFLVAFRIIDIFLRLGFVLVLMPLFVAAAVFPMTRNFTKKGWTFLLQIIVEFIGLAISAAFAMMMIEEVINNNSASKLKLLQAMAAEYTDDYGNNLLNAVTADMTLMFPVMLVVAVFLGSQLMKKFPIIIQGLFGFDQSNGRDFKLGSMATGMGAVMMSTKDKAVGTYNKAKGAAGAVANNPYQTKETKAVNAEKEASQKNSDLNKAKQQAEKVKGTPQEAEARKKVDTAQKEYDQAKQHAEALRREAENEKLKRAPSTSGYASRRFGDNAGNKVGNMGNKVAEKIDAFSSSKLMKSVMGNPDEGRAGFALGRLAAVPLILGAKTLSAGVRATTKTAEIGLKTVGRLGQGAQMLGNAVTGKKQPPKAPPHPK